MMDYNRKIIKDTFSENINKQKIYDNIINNSNKKYINYFKISLVPICVVIVLIFSINITNKENNMIAENKTYNENIEPDIDKDTICINSLKTYNNSSDIIGVGEDVKYSDIVSEQKALGNIKFPEDIKEKRCLKEYDVAMDNTATTTIRKSNESILEKGDFRGYNIMFYSEDELSYKGVDIFVSKTLKQRLRCTRIDLENFESSRILGKEVMIMSYYDNRNFIILFEQDGLYWDIEACDLTQEEIIDLIKSIIKESE